MGDAPGWTRDWRPPRSRNGLRYHDNPRVAEIMRLLIAMDPYQDRAEDRCDLLIVRDDKLWLWPQYAPNLHLRYVSMSVVVTLSCIIESFLVYATAEVLEVPIEALV